MGNEVKENRKYYIVSADIDGVGDSNITDIVSFDEMSELLNLQCLSNMDTFLEINNDNSGTHCNFLARNIDSFSKASEKIVESAFKFGQDYYLLGGASNYDMWLENNVRIDIEDVGNVVEVMIFLGSDFVECIRFPKNDFLLGNLDVMKKVLSDIILTFKKSNYPLECKDSGIEMYKSLINLPKVVDYAKSEYPDLEVGRVTLMLCGTFGQDLLRSGLKRYIGVNKRYEKYFSGFGNDYTCINDEHHIILFSGLTGSVSSDKLYEGLIKQCKDWDYEAEDILEELYEVVSFEGLSVEEAHKEEERVKKVMDSLFEKYDLK